MFIKHQPLRVLVKLQVIRYHSTTAATPIQSSHSQTSSSNPEIKADRHRKLRFAICGGGPAGFYSASRLLDLNRSELLSKPSIAVDLFEALPTPFGLSRYGVAPDHPEVKNCEIKFSEVAEHPNFRFFGNTKLIDEEEAAKLNEHGSGNAAYVTLRTLREEYDVVLLAYGASLDRCLGGIPGEKELENILPARAAVNWYNGYPTYAQHPEENQPFVDLSQIEHVTIIGQGNVALDIARILLTHVDDLAETDISSKALQALAQSRVKHVEIVGRRGPLQVAFTTKELRELIKLKDVDLKIDQTILLDAAHRLSEPKIIERMPNGRMSKRILDLMYKGSQTNPKTLNEKSCSINFLHTPLNFKSCSNINGNKKVKAIEWQLNKLDYPSVGQESDHQTFSVPDYSSIRAIPVEPETRITTSTDLVFKSLGYRPVIINPLEFDRKKSCAWNQDGRVIDKNGKVIPGLYVTGWLSRGPNGVIANTMNEAFKTVDTIIDDLQQQVSSVVDNCRDHQVSHRNDFCPTLINHEFRLDWNHWKMLDQFERSEGNLNSKPREKILSVVEMLKILRII